MAVGEYCPTVEKKDKKGKDQTKSISPIHAYYRCIYENSEEYKVTGESSSSGEESGGSNSTTTVSSRSSSSSSSSSEASVKEEPPTVSRPTRLQDLTVTRSSHRRNTRKERSKKTLKVDNPVGTGYLPTPVNDIINSKSENSLDTAPVVLRSGYLPTVDDSPEIESGSGKRESHRTSTTTSAPSIPRNLSIPFKKPGHKMSKSLPVSLNTSTDVMPGDVLTNSLHSMELPRRSSGEKISLSITKKGSGKGFVTVTESDSFSGSISETMSAVSTKIKKMPIEGMSTLLFDPRELVSTTSWTSEDSEWMDNSGAGTVSLSPRTSSPSISYQDAYDAQIQMLKMLKNSGVISDLQVQVGMKMLRQSATPPKSPGISTPIPPSPKRLGSSDSSNDVKAVSTPPMKSKNEVAEGTTKATATTATPIPTVARVVVREPSLPFKPESSEKEDRKSVTAKSATFREGSNKSISSSTPNANSLSPVKTRARSNSDTPAIIKPPPAAFDFPARAGNRKSASERDRLRRRNKNLKDSSAALLNSNEAEAFEPSYFLVSTNGQASALPLDASTFANTLEEAGAGNTTSTTPSTPKGGNSSPVVSPLSTARCLSRTPTVNVNIVSPRNDTLANAAATKSLLTVSSPALMKSSKVPSKSKRHVPDLETAKSASSPLTSGSRKSRKSENLKRSTGSLSESTKPGFKCKLRFIFFYG